MLATLVSLLLVAGDAPEVPLVGRPADLPFSGASAGFAVVAPGPEYRTPFLVSATATPAEVEELEAISFTVTVQAVGSVQHPPTRIDLRQVPAFARRFHVVDITDGKREQSTASTWRWAYVLRPRGVGIDDVPGMPFVFYNPDLKPTEKGFQTLWTDPIPLRVRTAERLAPPVEAPEGALALVTGNRVLRVRPAWTSPGAGLVAFTLAAPPCGCLVWYLLWRRRYPDAARLLHDHRSRSARRALRRLDAARRQRGRQRAEAVAGALGDYLHGHFDYPGVEPTPDEVAAWLRARGIGPELVDRARVLFAECAAGRFQPDHDRANDLSELGRTWILALEEVQCPPSP